MNPDLQSIYSSLNSVYDPQRQAIQSQIGNVQQGESAQIAGLDQAKTNAFGQIKDQANANGMMYSGAPIDEQQKYVGTSYLPAIANLHAQTNQNVYGLQTAANQLGTMQTSQANDMYNAKRNYDQQQKAYQDQIAQQERQFQQAQQASAQQAAQSLAAQKAYYGGSSSAAAAPSYSMAQGKNGGYSFFGPNGQSVSAGAYARANNFNQQQLAQLFAQSGNPADHKIAQDIQNGMQLPQLQKKYQAAFWGL